MTTPKEVHLQFDGSGRVTHVHAGKGPPEKFHRYILAECVDCLARPESVRGRDVRITAVDVDYATKPRYDADGEFAGLDVCPSSDTCTMTLEVAAVGPDGTEIDVRKRVVLSHQNCGVPLVGAMVELQKRANMFEDYDVARAARCPTNRDEDQQCKGSATPYQIETDDA